MLAINKAELRRAWFVCATCVRRERPLYKMRCMPWVAAAYLNPQYILSPPSDRRLPVPSSEWKVAATQRCLLARDAYGTFGGHVERRSVGGVNDDLTLH